MRRIGLDAAGHRDLRSGVARRSFELARRLPDLLAPRAELVVLVRPELRGVFADGAPGARLLTFESRAGPLSRRLLDRRRLRRLLRAEGIDLLLQDTRPLAWPERSLPCVHDLRFLDPEFSRGLGRRLYGRLLLGRELRRCPGVIAVSAHVLEALAARYGLAHERLHLVPNGVDGAFFSPGPPDGATLDRLVPGGGPWALAVGHREPRKNLAFLVEVLARLPEAWRLVVAGRPKPGDDLPRRLAAAGLARRALLLEDLDDPELLALYRGARVLLSPARLEGFGMTPLEAMSCGCPVLVSDRAPFDEFVPAEDRLAEDPEAWARRILLLEDAPERAAALRRVLAAAAPFTWTRSAALLARLL